MKKIWLLLVLGVVFIIPKGVEAKEYYTDTIYDEIGANNSFDLNVGDVIHHVRNNVDYSQTGGTDLGSIWVYVDGENYGEFSFVVIDNYDYEVRSYEEITGTTLPENKKVSIRGNITIDCAYTILNIYYTLEDEIQKQVVYHNTYDAENNNPITYYVNEADILLSDIEREGYKFLGWYTSPTFEEDTRITMISADEPEVLELYAKWEKIEDSEEIIDSNNDDNIFTNPETSSSAYVVIGILMVTILSTVLIIVYRIRKAGE